MCGHATTCYICIIVNLFKKKKILSNFSNALQLCQNLRISFMFKNPLDSIIFGMDNKSYWDIWKLLFLEYKWHIFKQRCFS